MSKQVTTPRLVTLPDAGQVSAQQSDFEQVLVFELGVEFGALAIRNDGVRYVNEHIQFLWLCYCRKVGGPNG